MEKGFDRVVPTPKSSRPGQQVSTISMQHLQACLSTYFDDIPDPLGRPNQTTFT